jgi:acyl-CoA thioesterase
VSSTAQTDFDRDTQPEPLGGGRYRVRFEKRWWIARGPNGGIVAAKLVRAMEAELAAPERRLRSITVHYPAAPPEGEAEVVVTVERSGRSMSTVSARLTAGDRLLALALGAFSTEYESVVDYDDAAMPEVVAPDPMPEPNDDAPMPFIRNWRMAPALGEHGKAVTGGWMAPREERPLDSALVVALTDAWVPAPFVVTNGRPFAAPTIDLTVHIRAALPRPAGPVLGAFRSSLARDGFFEEDGLLWAADGTLLAHSRQLALTL